jgi:hypothetical protein
MVTTTYKRFCDLSPLSPLKKNDSRKETAKSEANPAPGRLTFGGISLNLGDLYPWM